MKILIKGYYGFGNLGDDLLVLFFTRIIKKYFSNDEIFIFSNATGSNTSFTLEENYNQYLIHLLNIPSENIIDWTYKGDFEILINGGGGTFFDYTQASNLKKVLNKLISLFNPKSVFNIEQFIRKFLNKKLNIQFKKSYAIGNNVGPFDTNSSRFIQLYSKLGSIDDFLVRDHDSLHYLKKYNFKGNYEKISDVVFSNSYFPEIKEKIDSHEIKTVGIVLMNWQQEGEEYIKKFYDLTEKLKGSDIEVRYFAFSELDDEILKKYTNHNITIWKPNQDSIESYLNYFSKIDICISMRFHGLVIANCLGIPSVGISINNKIIDFVNQTPGANELVKEDFEIETLLSVIRNINQEYTKYVHNVKSYRNQFQNTEQLVENFIGKIKDSI